MIEKIYQYIKINNMVNEGDTVLVGVSGGADSVCLLYVLNSLKKRLGINLLAVHIHHGIRGAEADRDALFVKNLCETLEIDYEEVHFDIPAMARRQHLTEEEAGRIARYKCFGDIVLTGRAQKIAVAHNKNDNAETILFNLFRGSGVRGLGGIQPVRGNVIRPLLTAERKDIEAFLCERELKYCTDSTNLSEEYTRNKIRRNMLAYAVSEINEGALDNIVQAGSILSEAEVYLSTEAKDKFERLSKINTGEIIIDNNELKAMPFIMRKYVLMHALEVLCGRRKDITMKHIESAAELTDKETGHLLNLPYNMTALRSYDSFILRNELYQAEKMDIDVSNVSMRVFKHEKGQIIPQNMYTKWFDYDKISSTVEIRTRRTGDVIEILPGGQKKTVKRYMIDSKIPAEKRDDILLLADNENILWIIGYRMSEGYKITDSTQNILEVSIK